MKKLIALALLLVAASTAFADGWITSDGTTSGAFFRFSAEYVSVETYNGGDASIVKLITQVPTQTATNVITDKRYLYVDTRTTNGKNMLAQLLAAQVSGRQFAVSFTGVVSGRARVTAVALF